jgi:hypothetical protein
MVNDLNDLFECLEVFSGGQVFLNPRKPESYQENSKIVKRHYRTQPKTLTAEIIDLLFPERFKSSNGGTIHQWICAFLEETLISRYYEMQGSKKEIMNEYKEPLRNFKELEEYWVGINNIERTQV